jgi:hypothetical protein
MAKTPKKLKPMDEFEERVRATAVRYNITCFVPGSSTKVYGGKPTHEEAKVEAQRLIDENPHVRSAMVYAVDAEDRFALVGTLSRGGVYKPVVLKVK